MIRSLTHACSSGRGGDTGKIRAGWGGAAGFLGGRLAIVFSCEARDASFFRAAAGGVNARIN